MSLGTTGKYIFYIIALLPLLSYGQKRVFTIDECLQQAWQQNISLNQSRWNNEINKINYEQARENMLPTLGLSDAQNFNFGKYNNPVTQQSTAQNFSTNSLVLSSGVILFNGLQLQNLVHQNKANYEAGGLDLEKAKNDLGLSVLAFYLQVLFEYEDTAIAQSQIDATTEQLNRTKKYVAVGQLPELNLLQIQAQLARDNAAKVTAMNQLRLAKLSLMQLMEMPMNDDFEVVSAGVDDVPKSIAATPSEIYNNALSLLPDVRSAQTKKSASEYGLKAYKGVLYPKLSVSGNINTSFSSLNTRLNSQTTEVVQKIGYLQNDPTQVVVSDVPVTNVTKADYPLWEQYKNNVGQGIALNLSVPIFNSLLYHNNVRKARITVINSRLNESAVKNQLRKAIEQAYTDEVAAAKSYMASQEQLHAEERAYTDMEKKFMQGAANVTDFLVEKSNYNKALLALLQAKYSYIFRAKIINFYNTNSLTQ
ncbi:MAG: TolC family protein [Bacteroidetes bacterium]|nr:TolC family protein [Bacteroidota bacterium]